MQSHQQKKIIICGDDEYNSQIHEAAASGYPVFPVLVDRSPPSDGDVISLQHLGSA